MGVSRSRIKVWLAAAAASIGVFAFTGSGRAAPTDSGALDTGLTLSRWAGKTSVSAAQPLTRPASTQPAADHPLYLQPVNPAEERHAAPATTPSTGPAAVQPARTGQGPLSAELPPIIVEGEAPSALREEDRVGPNAQPRWTAETRLFPGTRIYVKPEGTAEFEYWLRPTVPRHGKTEYRDLFELELGLPHRLQLDLYLRTENVSGGPTQVGQSIELRYAFAEWNKIWGNPTLYVEWSRLEDSPDAVEAKLLLGGEIAPRWHWGINLSDELNTGGDRENEIEFTGGVSYVLIDDKLSLGVETVDALVDTKNHRGRFDDKSFFVGPSFRYRATERLTVDFAPLLGVTGESPRFQAYLVIGYEF